MNNTRIMEREREGESNNSQASAAYRGCQLCREKKEEEHNTTSLTQAQMVGAHLKDGRIGPCCHERSAQVSDELVLAAAVSFFTVPATRGGSISTLGPRCPLPTGSVQWSPALLATVESSRSIGQSVN